jgi:hypothetical protein
MGRFFEPQSIDEGAVEATIQSGRTPVIQYSHCAYPEPVLAAVDQACARFGEALEVRFFAHRETGFDAGVLRHLPNVANLSLDTLTTISHPEIVGDLPRLKRLRFGVYQLDDPEVVQRLGVARLTRLTLAENRKRNFDLAPLAEARDLTQLFVQGHDRNIEAISGLSKLEDLSLSGFPSRHDLKFANNVKTLRRIFLILGSRTSIDEFSHPGLQSLKVIWVKTLQGLGRLSRFPALSDLVVEDQLHIGSLDVSGIPLERLRLSNCKTLSRLDGLETLDRLRSLSIDRTALDLEALATRPWPSSLDTVMLFGSSAGRNRAIRETLAARGYRDFAAARSPA